MTTKSRVLRRESSDGEIVLGLLGAIERDPAVTQRSVASELGIALGLANAYLKRCVRKGLVKVGQAPARRYMYYLTPVGLAEKSRLTASYLAHSFSFFRRARSQCSEVLAAAAARGQRRVALIGESELAEIAGLVAREHGVEIIGTIPANGDARLLASSLRMKAGQMDAAVVTALDEAGEVYAAACQVIGAERVYAPPLLRIMTAGSVAMAKEKQ